MDTERHQLFILKKTKIFEYGGGEGDNTPPPLHPSAIIETPLLELSKKNNFTDDFFYETLTVAAQQWDY